MPSQLRYGQMS